MRAYRALSRFDPLRSFGAWVAKIAINRALTRAARRRPSASLDEAEADLEPSPSPEAGAARAEDASLVRRAIDELSPSDRALLALRYDEGLPVAEIASALGVGVGAIKVRLFRLRERLLERLPKGAA